MGVGSNRLRKRMNLIPDLRFGKDKSGSHKDTMSVDAFLSVLYSSVAETMPDKFPAYD